MTHAASLLETIPPAMLLAVSLFGAVTKAIENSSTALLEAEAIPARLVTWLGNNLTTDLRMWGIKTTTQTVTLAVVNTVL